MYGENKNWRYFIGFGLVILLLFVIIFMIVRGGGDEPKVEQTKRELISYANDSDVSVVQTTIGPIVAAQDHDEVQISVSNSSANIDVIKGYDGNVVDSRNYPMSQEGFREFLSALQKAGYTEGDTSEKMKDDTGYCANGRRYIFEIKDGSKTVQRFWSTSCDKTRTFNGRVGPVLTLFQEQIPEYNDLTGDLNLGSSLGSWRK